MPAFPYCSFRYLLTYTLLARAPQLASLMVQMEDISFLLPGSHPQIQCCFAFVLLPPRARDVSTDLLSRSLLQPWCGPLTTQVDLPSARISRFLPIGHWNNAAAPEAYYSRVLHLVCESDGAGGYKIHESILISLGICPECLAHPAGQPDSELKPTLFHNAVVTSQRSTLCFRNT